MQKKNIITNLKIVKIIQLFIGLVVIPFSILAAEKENNLHWIENNLVSIFDSLKIAEFANVEDIELDFSRVRGEKFGFIKNQVIKYINTKKTTAPVNLDSILFRIEQFDTRLVYQQSSTGFLNLGTEYTRENIVILSGWLEDKSENRILRSLNIKKTFSEKLGSENFTELEQSPYNFTKGEKEELSIWAEIVEPALVISSVGIIVYLFFSVRS